jgi:predicted TIM-barrel fold metal-dependent hydrolase
MNSPLYMSLVVLGLLWTTSVSPAASDDTPATWRADHRIIDLHQHIDCTTQHLARAVKIMDAVGIGLAVNLSGGSVVAGKDGGLSEFERNKAISDALYPGRFLLYMSLDFTGWDEPDFPEKAAQQVDRGFQLGAAGLKEFKRLGLYLHDSLGHLIAIDDPKLDPVWKRCGELGLPVSIHVADPKAFWAPFDSSNERWRELKDHKNWWFGDAARFPAWKDLLDALNRVIARHPRTTFVCVHFANNAEELDWVDESLTRYPNMMADLAARIPEIGRHDPEAVRRLFLKHADRILFATDFQVYDRLILGSSGDEPPPSDADGEVFFSKHWRFLETNDQGWQHMTPIQGDWTISSIGLPTPVLRKIYFDNARKLLARSLPAPTMRSRRISQDFDLTGRFDNPLWATAPAIFIEQHSRDGTVRSELSTRVRSLWSEHFLYLGYECPFTSLTVFEPPFKNSKRFDLNKEGVSLWDRDVVEAFIAWDENRPEDYVELEVAPTNEQLDLLIMKPFQRNFEWRSHFESAATVDNQAQVWRCELRIPLQSFPRGSPTVGSRWRLNLFRCDRATKAFLAFSPTLRGTFHAPDRFGYLIFAE